MTLGYVLSLCCNFLKKMKFAFSGISLPSQTAYSRVQAKMEFHYYYIILIASLTGLPAQLTRAARVSWVCQVFPSGKPLDLSLIHISEPTRLR